MRKIAFIILLIIIAWTIASDAKTNCALCGKEISGRYIKFDDGSVYCMDCVNRYTRCDICGKPSKMTTRFDHVNVCPSCLQKVDRCSFCNTPITGKYFSYPDLGLKLCPNCNRKVPRCDICGKPDLNLIRVGDKKICKACLDGASFCRICGNPIQGEYMWFDGDSTKLYCKNCVDKYQKCSSCGAPSGRHSHKLEDGRILCDDCFREGYFEASGVKQIKEKVLMFIENHMSMSLSHDIRYTLQGQDFIVEKSEGLSGDLNGLFHRRGDIYNIYVLYGLRRKDLFQVVSHEIAHAWAADNLRENLTLEEAEGFAQWVAYYTLKHFDYGDFAQTLLKGDNEYARGLHMMLKIESKGGQKAVFDYLAK